jgi:hypothetical protein
MQDGFTEIMAGLIFLVFPVMFIQPAFVSIFGAMYVLFLPQVVEGVRKKYVYPRIGYVKLRDDEPFKVTAGIVITAILMVAGGIVLIYLIAIDFISSEMIYRWVPAFFGSIMWFPSVYLKNKTGQNRYYLLAALMTITGFAVGFIGFIPVEFIVAAYSVSWGLAFLLLGIVRHALFIRKYPVIDSPEDDSGVQ